MIKRRLKNYLLKTFSVIIVIIFSSCNVRINKSIHVPDGKSVHHSLNTVNGSIYIGSDCEVRGDCRSVNGNIKVESESEVSGLEVVNGSIDLEEKIVVHGSIKSVNGSIRCKRECRIYDDIYTINGDIDVYNTSVRNDIKTINGDISLFDNSVVEKDIIIKRKTGSSGYHHAITIKITEGSTVKGDIVVHPQPRKVRVILSDGGTVHGDIRNAEVIKQ